MGNDSLHPLKRSIRLGALARQHAGGVEYVEPLVLHGAHVEVARGNDHEYVQVVLSSVLLFVPTHRAFQRLYGVIELAVVCRFREKLDVHVPAGAGRERIALAGEICRHHRKQVAGLLERILPGDPVTTFRQIHRFRPVAVAEQDREALLVRFDRSGERRHHVRAIDVVGDAAKALRFTLREEHALRFVESLEGRIVFRVNDRARP